MKASEVRIGNWLLIDNEERQIWAVGDIKSDWLDIDRDISDGTDIKIEGINLTEEELYKFGFKEVFLSMSSRWFELDGIKLINSREYDDTEDSISFYRKDDVNIYLPYVHNLQNLYFALTGKELTYEESQKNKTKAKFPNEFPWVNINIGLNGVQVQGIQIVKYIRISTDIDCSGLKQSEN